MFKTGFSNMLLAGYPPTLRWSEELAEKLTRWKGVNRVFYELNFNVLDPVIIKPIAIIYDRGSRRSPCGEWTEEFLFQLWMKFPSLVNNVLQGKFGQAGNNGRTFPDEQRPVGLGGFFDVAETSRPAARRG